MEIKMKYTNKTQALINRLNKIMKKQLKINERNLSDGGIMEDKTCKVMLKAHKAQTKAFRSE